MKPVLLDTGPLVALLDRSEEHHEACADLIPSLEGPLVTCEAVIAESCYILRHLRGAPEAVLQNVEQDVFLIPFRLRPSAPAVRNLMRKYRTVPMDFADACLVCLADELGTGRILTLDGGFTIFRWGRNRPFDLLLDL